MRSRTSCAPAHDTKKRAMVEHIRVASTALGEREELHAFVHDTLDEMRSAAAAFHHLTMEEADLTRAVGVTQGWIDSNGRSAAIIVRFAKQRLETEVIAHEMHHATTAIYGAHVGDRISRRAHLNHCNERFAYLYSDMLTRLVDELHKRGLLT